MRLIPLLILLVLPTIVYAEKTEQPEITEIPSWSTARLVMQECYGGWNIEVTVGAGYETRYYETGPITGPTANAMITVPLYSRKERLSRQESTNKQIEHLAELYGEVQSQAAIIRALSSETKVLKQVMLDSGQSGIKDYYGLLMEIENAKAKKLSAKRKIRVILENCGYVEANQTAGTR